MYPRGYSRRPELKELAFGKGIAMIVVSWGKMPFLCKPELSSKAIQHLFAMLCCSFLQVFVRDAFG